MKWLIDFFKWLKDIIVTLFEFVSDTISNIGKMIVYVKDALVDAWEYVDMLPSWLKFFATTTVIVSVVYIIIGRETGGK